MNFKKYICLSMFALLTSCITVCAEKKKSANVIEIHNKKEFDAILQKGSPVVVKFYSEMCGPCKESKPFFEEFSRTYPDIKFVAISESGKDNDLLFDAYEVSSYPTFVFIDASGNVVSSQSGFDKKDLEKEVTSFAQKKNVSKSKKAPVAKKEPVVKKEQKKAQQKSHQKASKSARSVNQKEVKEIKNRQEFEALLKKNKLVVAKFHSPSCPHCIEMAPIFEAISAAYPNVTFVALSVFEKGNKQIFDDYGVHGYPTFVFIKSGNKESQISGAMPKEMLEKKVQNFLKK